VAERGHTHLFQVLIGQITEDREIDVVLGKTLRVLGHAEFFEPIRNLLHRRPRADLPATTKAESLAIVTKAL
jgi:hypothetical protein